MAMSFPTADPNRFIQANTNGRLHDASEPSITPINRGFLYGDAIYEVWRTYHGVIFAWREHWARLMRSAQALHLELPASGETMLTEITCTAAAFRETTGWKGDLYIRLQITRGAGAIGLDVSLADRPDFVILVKPVPTLSEDHLRRGLRLSVATTLHRNSERTLNPAWKTGNYLNNILCLREARARGADEVLITNLKGEITEAAVCNVAFVRAGAVITPPQTAGILAGITRSLLIDRIGPAMGVEVREETVNPTDLAGMDECFLLSTTKDLQPVGYVDDYAFRVGEDTMTMRLKRSFAEYATEMAVAHPERRV